MKLTVKKREKTTKGQTKQLRRKEKIPGVFYSPSQESVSIELDAREFQAALRRIKKNHLSTTRFELEFEGKKVGAIVKGIQYDRTSYEVLHVDLVGLEDKTPVTLSVPVECVGLADCVGVKLGGVLRQPIRNVKVRCLPKQIPSEFPLDIRDLKMKESKRISDLKFPEGVKPVLQEDEVIAVIAKR